MNQAQARQKAPSDTKSRRKVAKLLASHRKDASRSLRRLLHSPGSSLMTVFVIAMALLLPALLVLLNSNLAAVLDQFQSSARITLYLEDEISETRGIEVSESLLTDGDIDVAAYVSSSQALAEFSAASGFSGILAGLSSNPLPATIIVRPSQTGLTAVDGLAARLQSLPEVELVQLDSQWLQRLLAITELIAVITRILGVIVIVGLCFIVGNTIKLGVESRRDEIRVLKLVGGTDGFIARPFLYSGLLFGLLGGLLCSVMLVLVAQGFSESLAELTQLYNSDFQLGGLGLVNGLIVTGFGGLIGWFAALLASFRFIAAIEP